MAAVSPLTAAVGVEDFALDSEEAETPSHSREQTFSSPPAPPLSAALSPDTRDYNFSSSIYDDYAASRSTSAHEDEYTTEEEDLDHLCAPAVVQSTRSSISSFPGSVLPDSQQHRPSTPKKPPNSHSHPEVLHHGRSGSLSYKIRSPASRLRDNDRNVPLERDYGSGFRNPSSVRAMQMRDEEPFDSDVETTPNHRRSGSRMSNFSCRSANASPTKNPSRSKQSTPHKISGLSKLKKEFPLVLLHCSLLPPTLALKTHITDEALMEEVLPAEYWRRWKILQDKVGEDNEVRTRGVLIPHPRDDYDILEERLLESLELERARIRKGHYIDGTADVDSGMGTESERDTENESEVESQSASAGPKPGKCPDCGKRVPKETEVDRKWEVKVYAANGLMRAGAWAAAWSEMEKVDVEVSVWMPEAVRREIDARLKELGAFDDDTVHHEHDDSFVQTEEERRQQEIYGRHSHGQESVDGLTSEHTRDVQDIHLNRGLRPHQGQSHADIQTLALNYVRATMQDRRNIFMTFLSILVLFLAIAKPQETKEITTLPGSVLAGQEAPVTITSFSTSTSTEVVTATVVAASAPAVSSALSEPTASLLLNTAGGSSSESREEMYKTSTITLIDPAEPTELDMDRPSSTSTVSGHEDDETPVVEQNESTLLEKVVQMLPGDDGMVE